MIIQGDDDDEGRGRSLSLCVCGGLVGGLCNDHYVLPINPSILILQTRHLPNEQDPPAQSPILIHPPYPGLDFPAFKDLR